MKIKFSDLLDRIAEKEKRTEYIVYYAAKKMGIDSISDWCFRWASGSENSVKSGIELVKCMLENSWRIYYLPIFDFNLYPLYLL